jgi:rsbT co-antagonist protein RsbR
MSMNGFEYRRRTKVASSTKTDSHVTRLPEVLAKHSPDLLSKWIAEQLAAVSSRKDLIKETELREQSRQFLSALGKAVQSGTSFDAGRAEWSAIADFLTDLSRSRAAQGFTPSETALFVFSLRPVLLDQLQVEFGHDAALLGAEVRNVTVLLDKLGLFTVEAFVKSREQIIARQQKEMMELSTPVVSLFEGILAVPLIGTLDSARTQVVMESLLERIVETGAEIAIIDITGVPTVDTLVAQHLLKTVAATRLMGADCIISGIRPQIAQTIVHLGVDLQNVTTKATLAGALTTALRRAGLAITRTAKTGKHSGNSAPKSESQALE